MKIYWINPTDPRERWTESSVSVAEATQKHPDKLLVAIELLRTRHATLVAFCTSANPLYQITGKGHPAVPYAIGQNQLPQEPSVIFMLEDGRIVDDQGSHLLPYWKRLVNPPQGGRRPWTIKHGWIHTGGEFSSSRFGERVELRNGRGHEFVGPQDEEVYDIFVPALAGGKYPPTHRNGLWIMVTLDGKPVVSQVFRDRDGGEECWWIGVHSPFLIEVRDPEDRVPSGLCFVYEHGNRKCVVLPAGELPSLRP